MKITSRIKFPVGTKNQYESKHPVGILEYPVGCYLILKEFLFDPNGILKNCVLLRVLNF